MINARIELAGVVRKEMTASDVHVNRALTNVSIGYTQDESRFIADRIFPRVPVTKQSDIFTIYPAGEWNRDEMKLRAPATETAGTGYDIDRKPYYCPVWGVHRDVDDQMRANQDEPMNLDAEATRFITRKGLIRREVEFADKFFKSGAWTYQKTGVASAPGANQFLQWNDSASEPTRIVRQAQDEMLLRTGFMPNVLVLGHLSYSGLLENDSIIDRIKYGQTPGAPAMVTKEALAALFGVDRIEVMSAIVNTAPEGQTANSFLGAARGALLVHAAPTPGLLTPSAGYTFVWTGYNGASPYGTRIIQFRMENIRSDRFEIDMAFTHEKVADDLGIFLADAVAAPL